MARVVITGAGGFIGQHLSLALLKSGWSVRGIGRSLRPSTLDRIEWISGDILDQQFVDKAVADSEVVIHLACLPLGQSAVDPVRASQLNTEGTLRVLEAARKAEVKRFIFTSTSQVYGGRASLPNRESDLPRPDSAYAASKYSAEVWCEAYKRIYALPVVILRLFNVYGLSANGTPRSTVETIFLRQAKNGIQPVITGNPQSGRDFIHIDDVVRATELALSGTSWEGPLNIGTGVITTLDELAHLAAEIHEKEYHVNGFISGEPSYRLQADSSWARTVLGFQANVAIENGMKAISRLL